jgi:hypothetical protein
MEEQHVPDAAIRKGRAEHWDVVFPGPVVDAVGVVDFLAKPGYHLQNTWSTRKKVMEAQIVRNV